MKYHLQESNPQYLEDNILKQIRVLVESQKLLIWVYDKTLVQVKVTSVLPPSSNNKTDRPAAPYLITNETEIIVSPKTRFDSSVQESAQKNQILGDAKGVDTTTSKEKNPLTGSKKIDFKILPQAFSLVLGTEDSAEATLAPGATSNKPYQSNSLDECPIVALNPIQLSQVERIFPTKLCSLDLLIRPNQASSSKQTSTSTAPATAPPEISIRHGPNKSSKTSKKSETKPAFPIPHIADRVRLTPHSGVPVGFIYLPIKFRQKWFSSLAVGLDPRSSFRLDQAGDYEYVRFVFICFL
jgi:peroxin-1